MTFHQPQTPELSVPALVAWLRTERGDNTYVYQDPVFCLLGRYFEDQGAVDAISEAAYETMPDYRAIAEPKPHTFGAALERAEKLLALPAPTPTEELPHALEDQKEPVTLQAPFVENQR